MSWNPAKNLQKTIILKILEIPEIQPEIQDTNPKRVICSSEKALLLKFRERFTSGFEHFTQLTELSWEQSFHISESVLH